MSNLLLTLPLQIACQLIGPGNSSYGNFTIIENITVSSQQPAQQLVLPDGYTAFEHIGLAYKFNSASVTWNEARKNCIAEGAVLAVLDSFKKIGYAVSLNSWNPWVGIHKTFDKTEWTSVKTSLAVSSIPWKTGADLSGTNKDCAYFDYMGSGLNTNDCSSRLSYICEIEIPNNNTKDGR